MYRILGGMLTDVRDALRWGYRGVLQSMRPGNGVAAAGRAERGEDDRESRSELSSSESSRPMTDD